VFRRTQKKYGPRGYRYILLEAGHCGQNFCLKAAELGLSTLCMGGFVDSGLNMMLGLQQKEEGVVYTVAAGYAAAK
jgi:SagB-type dehydrogenase family enzyme